MVVDCHAHVIVPGLGAEVEWVDGSQVVRFGGREIRAAVREFVDVESWSESGSGRSGPSTSNARMSSAP